MLPWSHGAASGPKIITGAGLLGMGTWQWGID